MGFLSTELAGRHRLILSAGLLFLIVLFWLAGGPNIAVGASAGPDLQEANLLRNPGFEGRFRAWNGMNEIQVADQWTPWWSEDPARDPPYFRPEYKRALIYDFPKRVLSGESAQQWFTFHASHLAGMYQQVFNVTPGQRYRFTIWAQVWSSSEDNPDVSVLPANPRLQVGIDPTGLWNAGSSRVIWSAEGSMSSFIDQWAPIGVEATAQNDIITVFMRTNPDFANKHNDMYWDNASVVAVGPPEPTPELPTDTPGPPTSTPLATAFLTATNTPVASVPSDTQVATKTQVPSETVIPSATPSALPPTETPIRTPTTAPSPESPTSTPIPSPTPFKEPTSTPVPNATPTDEATVTAQSAAVAAAVLTADALQEVDTDAAADGQGLLTSLGLLAGVVLISVLLVATIVFLWRGRES